MTAKGRPNQDDENDDEVAARYLKRMRGEDSAATEATGSTPSVPTPPAVPATPPARTVEVAVNSVPASSLPAGAPRITAVDPAAPPPDLQLPGSLPMTFVSEGLTLLRKGDFAKAADYYQELAKRSPAVADGWLGVGASLLGNGDIKQSIPYLIKGKELDPGFPVGALVAEVQPGHPRELFNVADALTKLHTGPANECAYQVIDEVLASPLTPASLYAKADELKKKIKRDIEWLQAQSNPELLHLRQEAKQFHLFSSAFSKVILLALVAAISYGIYYLIQWGRADALYKVGMMDYVEGNRIAVNGEGKLASSMGITDPMILYKKSYDEFDHAATMNPKSVDYLFMTVQAGQQITTLSSARKGTNRPSDQELKAVRTEMSKFSKRMKELDPSGAQRTTQEAALKQALADLK